MKRLFTFTALVVVILGDLLFANQQPENPNEPQDYNQVSQEQFLQKEKQVKELVQELIKGRKLQVRVYNNWQTDPRAYKLVSVPLKGLSVSLDAVKAAFGDMYQYAVITVTAQDQQDKAVAAVVGDFIHVEIYKKDKSLSIWPPSFTDQNDYSWTFKDALGNTIINAEVQIFLNCSLSSSRRPKISGIWLFDTKLDENSRLKPVRIASKYWQLDILMTHPEFGSAYAVPYGRPIKYFLAPFAPMNEQTIRRSLWGTVVDAKGDPVSSAIIRCGSVVAPGGAGTLVFPAGHRVIADEKGSFLITVPIKEGTLAPINAKYNIGIKIPDEPGLTIDYGHVTSGKECTISLNYARYFHRFSFEDANGPINDTNKLKNIRINIKGLNFSRSFGYDDWKDGGKFPPGVYKASFSGKQLIFSPLHVTSDSPEHLVFKATNEIVYYGQVINGSTSQPIPGVIVMAGDFIPNREGRDLSLITAKQWQAIHALGPEITLDDAALQPLKEFCQAKKVSRTDQDGYFVISTPPGKMIRQFVIAQEHYISSIYWNGPMPGKVDNAPRPDENGFLQIPLIKLFPAATMTFEPYIKEEDDTAKIRVQWIIKQENNPAWAKDLKINWYYIFQPNKKYSIHVPAGVNIEMVFFTSSKLFGNEFCERIIQPITNLKRDQRVDLGRLFFELSKETIPIHLKVLDFRGQAVEGVGVWRVLDGQSWGHNSITDKSGKATFKIPMYSRGVFFVSFGEQGKELKESTPFEVAGEEDADREFILHLSNEILNNLFK
ncbi:MAG: hypothetical protein ACYSWZ_11205 [Planctomycetota bacterium]